MLIYLILNYIINLYMALQNNNNNDIFPEGVKIVGYI